LTPLGESFNPRVVMAASKQEASSAISWLDRLSERGRALVTSTLTRHQFPKGTRLLSEGQICHTALVVAEGRIRVFRQAPEGREITLYTIEPGESCVLGVACLLAGGDAGYPAQAQAAAETEAVALPAAVFRQLFATEPAVQHFVMDLYNRRLAAVMTLVEEVAFRRMDERLAAYLLRAAESEPGVFRPIMMTHEQVAHQLGTTREVVSRLLLQLEDEGAVELGRGSIRVVKAEGLRRKETAL